MKSIKSMAMVSLLVLGQGLSASDDSYTSAITKGSKDLLKVEACVIPLVLTLHSGSQYIGSTWHNTFQSESDSVWSLSDHIKVAPIIAATAIPAIGVAGTGAGLTASAAGGMATDAALDNLDLSPYVGKNAEAGIYATAATGLCVGGLAFTGIHPAASVLPCTTFTALFIAATGFNKSSNSK